MALLAQYIVQISKEKSSGRMAFSYTQSRCILKYKGCMSGVIFILALILLPSSIAAAFNIGEIVFKAASYVIGAALFIGFVLFLLASFAH